MPVSLVLVVCSVLFTTSLVVLVRRSIVVAQPDEWLLAVRNGRLVTAGVGIYLLRKPGDVVARFTSTMQRVGFCAEALSNERLAVQIEGFIFWSVSPDGDDPFRAFQKLGLVNLNRPPRDLKSPKHLMSAAQHRAFRELLEAAVQRLAASRSLEDLLLRQDALVDDLRRSMSLLEAEMGIHVDRIEIAQVRPTDEALLRAMGAQVEEQVRERAAQAKLEASERTKQRALLSEARLSEQKAETRRQELEQEKALRAIEMANEELQLAARLDRVRREAEAQHDAICAVAAAEEKKSQGVRDSELAKLVAEKVGDALKAMPLRDARWITVGPDSPASSLAALLTSARELTRGGPGKAA